MAGASYDIVVLSSSPPAHDYYAPSSPLNGSSRPSPRRVAMPVSPLPALSPLASPQKKASGASALSSRRASIPPDAIRGFATVGSLVRSEHFGPQLDNDTAKESRAPLRAGSPEAKVPHATTKRQPRKRAVNPPAVDSDAKPKPKSRSRISKTADKEPASRDPELRLPVPKISPYFPTEGAETSNRFLDEASDTLPKLTKSGKPRKPRAKKEKVEEGDVEPKPKKTRVARLKKTTNATGKLQQEDPRVDSAHFRQNVDEDNNSHASDVVTRELAAVKDTDAENDMIWEVPESPQPKKKRPAKSRPSAPAIGSLDLDEAVSRRRDWTPPRDTTIASPFTDSIGKENKQIGLDASNENFTYMVSNFAYAQAPAVVTATTTTSTEGGVTMAKRRRVELIDVPGNGKTSRNASPEKGKAPKKKPRTITDIATEQYQCKNDFNGPSETASEFFRSPSTVTKVPLNDISGDAPLRKPTRKRPASKTESEKGGTKARSKKASTKAAAKPKAVAEKLLSPGSALVRMSKQDILFGTSSQLALEESPTLVRQIQFALKESEIDAEVSPHQLRDSPPRWPKLDQVKGKRGLWDASSRDAEGGLLEQTQDIYIPEFDRTQDFPLLMDGTSDELAPAHPPLVNIDEPEPAVPLVISSDAPTPPWTTLQASETTAKIRHNVTSEPICDSVFEDIDDFNSQPPPSNQNMEFENSFVDIDDLIPASAQSGTSPPPKPRPPASAPRVTSPKKYPSHHSKSQPVLPTASIPPPSAAKPKKKSSKTTKSISAPPATPLKSSGRFYDIDEILDSEDESRQALSPTPPRVRNFADSQPLPLVPTSPTRATKTKPKSTIDRSVVSVHRIPSAHLEWTNIKGSVFASITAHIRSLQPTTDPKKPSWHEKILMYDPIVLEEFTADLNASTDVRTWKRATKIQTKAWNKELKAVDEEAVFVVEGGEEVLAVKKELEATQVQAWCESMSVCCIWGEGRGKGGVRKGFY